VLEEQWSRFLKAMDETQNLNDIKAAHDEYVDSIIDRIRMGHDTPDRGVDQSFFQVVRLLFVEILRFDDALDMIYNSAQSALFSLSPAHPFPPRSTRLLLPPGPFLLLLFLATSAPH
jgi:hypothetical protein